MVDLRIDVDSKESVRLQFGFRGLTTSLRQSRTKFWGYDLELYSAYPRGAACFSVLFVRCRFCAPFRGEFFIGESFDEETSYYTASLESHLFASLGVIPVG
jgi:hypothetical protein